MPKVVFRMVLDGLTVDNWAQVEPAVKEGLSSSYDVSVENIQLVQAEDNENIVQVEIEAESDLDAQALSSTIEGD